MTREQELLVTAQLDVVLRELDKLGGMGAQVSVDRAANGANSIVRAHVVIPFPANKPPAERRRTNR